jgi:hypothetical protein
VGQLSLLSKKDPMLKNAKSRPENTVMNKSFFKCFAEKSAKEKLRNLRMLSDRNVFLRVKYFLQWLFILLILQKAPHRFNVKVFKSFTKFCEHRDIDPDQTNVNTMYCLLIYTD